MPDQKVLHQTLGEFRANFAQLTENQKQIADTLTDLSYTIGEIQRRQEALEEKLNKLTLEGAL